MTHSCTAALSFHETKNIISGERGALLINSPGLIERAEVIREKGTDRSQFFRRQVEKYAWVDFGSSYLPIEFVAAFHYVPLHSSPVGNKAGRVKGDMQNTDICSEKLIRLPIWLGIERYLPSILNRISDTLMSL